MLGSLNSIEGIAAIGNGHFFIADAHYVFGDLNTWGWVVLSIGVLRLLVDVGVFARDQFARWTGVVALSDAAIDALCEDMRHMGVSTRLGE